jgi:hypothetical protein
VSTHLVHGIRVVLEGDLPAAERLLARFPGCEGGAPDLLLALGWARRPFAPRAGDRGLMFHGPVRVIERRGAIHVTDGASEMVIAAGGRRIEGAIHRSSLRVPYALENELLLITLVLALRWHGLFHLHAAAVAGPAGGIVIPGAAGAGKSTLTLALVHHGFDYLSDDAIFVTTRAGQAAALAFPRPFHVAEKTARAFPATASSLEPGWTMIGKRALDPRRFFPGRERTALESPGLLIVPSVSAGPLTNVESLSDAEALGALIESSAILAVDQMPAVGDQLSTLRALVGGAVCVRVALGEDLLLRPVEVVARMLEAIDASGRSGLPSRIPDNNPSNAQESRVPATGRARAKESL